MIRHLIVSTSVLAIAASIPAAAAAQETAQTEVTGLGEIVVTAQRREESLQNAAVNISAVTADEITNRNVTNASDLSRLVPALKATPTSGPYTNYSIRGIQSPGNSALSDPTVQVSIDGVALGSARASRGLFYDLERVEVLKGPQGTLYGRNATAGAINVISAAPRLGEYSGDASLAVGNFNRVGLQGAANIPIGETAALRVAVQSETRDGYFSDGTGDEDRQSIRAAFRVEPTDSLSVVIRTDYTQEGGRGPGATAVNNTAPFGFVGDPYTSIVDQSVFLTPRYAPAPCGAFPNAVSFIRGAAGFTCRALPRNQYLDNRYAGLSAEVNWDVAGGTLTLIPAHREENIDYLTTATGLIIAETNKAKQNSFEARYATDASRRLRGVVGAFWFDYTQQSTILFDQQRSGTTGTQTYSPQVTSSVAVFGDATFAVTDTFRLSAGLRYTKDEKALNGRLANRFFFQPGVDAVQPEVPLPGQSFAFSSTKSWESTDWRLSAEWNWREGSLLYANVSTGYKAGGFFMTPDPKNTYEPEEVTAYAIGSKNRFFDNRLQLNGEVFLMDYTNQQIGILSVPAAAPNALIFPQQNAGAAQIRGVDLDAQFLLTENTLLSTSVSYLDTEYEAFNPTTVLLGAQNCPFTVIPAPAGSPFTAIRLNCAGRPLARTPEFSATFGLRHTFPLASGAKLVLDLNHAYVGQQWTDTTYSPPSLVPETNRTDAAVTYSAPDDRWSLQAYVENIDDDADVIARAPSPGGVNIYYATVLAPRTYGLRVKASF